MKVIKRDGREVKFDKQKIIDAVLKAFKEVDKNITIDAKIKAREIANYIESLNKNMTIEEIQEEVINQLMASARKDVATKYVEYKYKRNLVRESNTTDKSILELIDGTNDYWNFENSNKSACVVTTQRDYLAGITSTDITRRFLLPKDVVQAHDEGIIHFHDADYFAQHMHNCCLINLEDMLQNGTVINGTLIEKPHKFLTAMTIATQIITAVTSSQYGGATITLTHLAPFVRDSFNGYIKKYQSWGCSDVQSITWAKKDLQKEIQDGVQTFQYQLNSMTNTNGQSPFLSVFMYLGETKEYKEELAMIIQEMLRQRIEGLKNEGGVYITPAFPKLLYVLEEDNIYENSKYWYLTELAAKCTAKRMVPDFMSEKVMKKLKDGNMYPVMGCVDGKEIITYRYLDDLYVESFERMWERFSDNFEIKHQYTKDNPNLYMDLLNVEIYDTKKGFVNANRIIRNISNDWLDVHLTNGRRLLCTSDHLFEIQNRGCIKANDLKVKDKILINSNQYSNEKIVFNKDKAWFLGFMLCDGCYQHNCLFASIAANEEDEIEKKFISIINDYFELSVTVKLQERGKKGIYKDLLVLSNNDGGIQKIGSYLTAKYGGVNKVSRHIPNEVFEWDYKSKLAFMAGMIDADGYINNNAHGGSVVQIGSTNKELALQQMALAQSLGMPAKIYHNCYTKKKPNAIRYRVEFYPIEELLIYIVCNKKREHYRRMVSEHYNKYAEVIEISPIKTTKYSYDITTDSEHFEVSGIYSHNCRSALTVWKDKNDTPKFYGRFNQGVVTINLVDLALSSNKNFDRFWELFEQRTELCHKALKCRHERLEGTLSDAAPIMWQYGALARLDKHTTIDELLHNGYSTLSLGYAGLYECVKYMTDKSHTDNAEGTEFGLHVMRALNDKCNQWKKEENIDYSLYGTPIESTTYKFAKCLQKRFGVIGGITDKNYITNSYHVNVREEINPFEKLEIESKFQELSPGGAISYIESSNMNDNIPALLEVIKFIYENIMYAEINTKSDYCQVCGYDGEIEIIKDKGELIWQCPNCKNRDQDKMNIARRTCGYIGSHYWNQGRTQEIAERFVHLDDHEY